MPRVTRKDSTSDDRGLIVMMGHDRFLYCRACNEAHKATPFDQAPIYDVQGEHVREIPTDDRRQFTGRHAGHAIEELSTTTEVWLNSQGAIDPMAESFVALANQGDFIVLHRSRRSIAEAKAGQAPTRWAARTSRTMTSAKRTTERRSVIHRPFVERGGTQNPVECLHGVLHMSRRRHPAASDCGTVA